MRLTNVEARTIVFHLELTLEEVFKLRDALDKCEVRVDSTNPESVEANRFLTEEFYPFMSHLSERGEERGS